ncbi:MAG: hypothetical protein ACFFBD_20135 [Candidatus Hodarchaeota archaeon]
MRYSRKLRYTLFIFTLTALIFVSLSMIPIAFSEVSAEEITKTTLFKFKSSNRVPLDPDEFRIVFHVHHDPILERNQYSDLINLLNDTYQVHFNRNKLREEDLDNNDVLVILGSTEDYEPEEINVITNFVNRGGSLLVTGDEDNNVKESLDPILEPFGISFGNVTVTSENNSPLPDPYVLAKDFSTPRIPVLDNVTQLVYHGVNLTLNETFEYQWNETLIPHLKERYPLIFAAGDTSEGYDLTVLSAVVELNKGRSRILAVGSSNMWNNSFIQNKTERDQGAQINIPSTSINLTFVDNTLFAENAFKWVCRSTGHFKLFNDSIEAPVIEEPQQFATQNGTYQTLEVGEIISGSVMLRDWHNQSLSSTNLTFSLERTGRILRSAQMVEDENGTFSGYLNTTGISKGWIDATFVANRRGYIETWYEAEEGRIWLIPEAKVQVPINPAMLALLGAAVVIFAISLVFILKLLPSELPGKKSGE